MEIFEQFDYYDNLFNDDSNRRLNFRVPLRYLRDVQDPYNIENFKKRYRFSQDVVKSVILPLIDQDLRRLSNRGNPIAPELQILVCLRFYATASFQIVCGDLLNVSQPAASNIVANISRLIALQQRHYIKYPQDMISHRAQFAQLGQYQQNPGLRNVDGAIDCTHIKIVNTPGVEHHEAYRNRKSYFSINVQAVVGPFGNFMDIVARWAGSTHDSRIFQMCLLRTKYIHQQHSGYLIGDSGYPCLRFLLTPVGTPTTHAEQTYNRVHVKTRNVVERTFGRWKRRFPCLSRGLGNKLTTVSNIIVACAVLFNISLSTNDMMPSYEEDGEINEEVIYDESNSEGTTDGFAFRNTIISNYS
ncbi:putative nuclease HARBI1 [Trichoplusia ni]|uniref:Putative nuclease HARBI1 n=1 Tax=Trichoplusia ni TaxID=7111 RepID=A0A7E5W6K0_TRINI|nr:putative nuclease HARBI1 [Trichoplusia ni]